jgi:nucleoside-diphosphate-sugar epimerase
MLIEEMANIPEFRSAASSAVIKEEPSSSYYGAGYDDMRNRVPSVRKMEELLGWRPCTPTREILRRTVEWHASEMRGGAV